MEENKLNIASGLIEAISFLKKKVVVCGIYKITSPSGKIYIGQSVNIYKRWASYKHKSCNQQPKLYNSILKYGIENHKFEVIEVCQQMQLDCLEKTWFHNYKLFNSKNSLNIREAGGGKGRLSEETKAKISQSNKGIHKMTPELKEKLLKFHLGRKQTPQEIENRISKIRGLKRTEQQIKNISQGQKNRSFGNPEFIHPNTGRKMNQETREKLANIAKGRVVSSETRKKISEANLGGKRSKEQREKMSVAMTKIWALKKVAA